MGLKGHLSPLGKIALSKVRGIPLSNDTMARRVDWKAEDLEDQLAAKKLLLCWIATHTPETCSNNVIVKIWAKAFTQEEH